MKALCLLVLYILNHSGQTAIINGLVILDTIFEKIIIISIYPFIVTIKKDDKLYSKRKLVEYLFSDIGVLVGGVAIGRTLGNFLISYNICLLISIIFLLMAFITILNIKKPVIQKKSIELKETLKYISKDKIVKIYVLDYIVTQSYNENNKGNTPEKNGKSRDFEMENGKENKTGYRVEQDSIGAKDIPGDVYYGVQSLRAAENFRITGLNMHPEIINSLAYIKKASAITNCESGILEKKKAKAIVQACDEILTGKLHEYFIVDPIQGGAGTSLNMNANEVIANRAIEILGGKKGDYSAVNPNDDVNCGQSTNDVIPTAGKMTSLRLLQNLKKELLRLHGALCKKAEEFDHVIKMGRTQMQDAVPIRLGQEFQAYSDAIMRDIHRMDNAMDEMRTVNMGGTAVGTGINADEAYVSRIVPNLSKISDIQFVQAFDLIDATQNLDPFVAVSGAVKACAVTLSKIANDLRLMSSGPRAGFGEINLPAKQNGSSIMPGKVNPVIPEVVNQVTFNIIGNDVTITMAAEGGQLELNAFEPIVFYCLFQSIDTLAYAVQTFIDNCVTGITANEERCRQLVENSIGVITAICPHVGYEKAAEIAKKAMKTGESIRNLILREGLLSEKEMETVLDPVNMTEPGISGKELLRK